MNLHEFHLLAFVVAILAMAALAAGLASFLAAWLLAGTPDAALPPIARPLPGEFRHHD